MIGYDRVEQLRYKGEGADLDFKQAQYGFIDANDHQKSELLKDILAMANAYRDGPGYILIGFKDQTPHPAEVTGISPSDHIDDAALQQFIGSKVQPKLSFSYEEKIVEGKTVAIITVPKQQRPFFLVKDFGKLGKSVVYVRRGSSTDEASPLEVVKMGRDDTERGVPQIELAVHDEQNRPFPNSFQLNFLIFNDRFPDYDNSVRIDMGGIVTTMQRPIPPNRGYWRDGAAYHSAMNRLIRARLSLTNRSDFSLVDAKLEVTCTLPGESKVEILRADYLPNKPATSDWGNIVKGHVATEHLNQRIAVDDRGPECVCHIRLGTLLPGETGCAQDDLAILPAQPGSYVLRVRILAGEINTPIVKEYPMEISGALHPVGFKELRRLMLGG